MARASTVVLLTTLLTACNPPGGSTLGARTRSGLVRVSEASFGLLIYPCVPETLVSEVVLSDVDMDGTTQVILRERYPEPVHPRDLMVSTDPTAEPAVPEGEREIVDAALLDRFNTDPDYLTAIIPRHFHALDAYSPNGDDVSGGSNLGDRFEVPVGRVSGLDLDPVRVDDVRCPDQDEPAWAVSTP